MLLIRTYLAPSSIHGNGVFAAEDAPKGTPLWRFEPGVDLIIPFDRIAELPEAFRAYLDMYAYESTDFPGAGMVLSCDHAKFHNHSDDPNTDNRGPLSHARRDIKAGDEITCDYREFCVGWTGFD